MLDECSELIEPTGVKTQEGKEEDALKQEIVGLIKSITQLRIRRKFDDQNL